ncbi:MAG: hypothetical protein AAGE03_17340 [Pseudomonadota bacterium]
MKKLPEISLVWVAALLALAITLFGLPPERSMIADIDIPRNDVAVQHGSAAGRPP